MPKVNSPSPAFSRASTQSPSDPRPTIRPACSRSSARKMPKPWTAITSAPTGPAATDPTASSPCGALGRVGKRGPSGRAEGALLPRARADSGLRPRRNPVYRRVRVARRREDHPSSRPGALRRSAGDRISRRKLPPELHRRRPDARKRKYGIGALSDCRPESSRSPPT